MIIESVEAWSDRIPLSRPYSIAGHDTSSAELFFVRLIAKGGVSGIGSAAPVAEITGEDGEVCARALASAGFLKGRDARRLGEALALLERELNTSPAARAALDMALFDLLARYLAVPVFALLGAPMRPLPTSVTIGILPLDRTLEEAREHVEAGFRCLKVKIGRDVDEDVERLRVLRGRFPDVGLRVDANQGYSIEGARRILDQARRLGLELVEQPVPRGEEAALGALPESARDLVALDESAFDEKDAARLLSDPRAGSVLVVKLMKCGGLAPARRIADLARAHGARLMWGCMDESRLGIAAALHAALSSPATAYLDLDGSFDLSRDPARGGFRLEGGRLIPEDAPGFGVELDGP